MLDEIYSTPYATARLRVQPLGGYFDGFARLLFQQGYPVETIRTHFVCLRRLNSWLAVKRATAETLDEVMIDDFASELSLQYKKGHECHAARLFLQYLRETSVNLTSPPKIGDQRTERLVSEYVKFLRDERGLSEDSIKYYALYYRRFLIRRSDGPRVPISKLQAKDVVEFVTQLPRGKGSRLPTAVTSLRTIFRYLYYRGKTKEDLSVHVPGVAQTARSLPKSLTPEQVRLVLQQCDKRTPCGRRDYAVLMLLSRLGLRSGEVRRLKLDDINWHEGEITIRGKGRRLSVLPLPADVGRALSAYLERGRPDCTSRFIFIRARAPYVEFTDASAVAGIALRCFRAAKLPYRRLGPHVFRHTLATRLLRQGRSMEEIAQVMRHANVDSTANYARVHTEELRNAAAPWPETKNE
ncbi:MAG: tyrosine-type recombinase/integrase [Planctomycetaceae bacterium]|nr:tyrosine-type recombinase/integrase [Planctomycetaceae bacterium]